MPHLDMEHSRIFYQQSGIGPDIVWLAGGDTPGSSWQEFHLLEGLGHCSAYRHKPDTVN